MSKPVQKAHITSVNKGAPFVAECTGHGAQRRIAPHIIRHRQGDWVEQRRGDLPQAGVCGCQIVGVQAQDKLAMTGRGDPAGMTRGQTVAEHDGGEPQGFVRSAAIMGIEGEMDGRAGGSIPGAMQREGKGRAAAGQHDDLSQPVGSMKNLFSYGWESGQGWRIEDVEGRCQADDAGRGVALPYDGNAGDGNIWVMRENATSSAGRKRPIHRRDRGFLLRPGWMFRRNRRGRNASAA